MAHPSAGVRAVITSTPATPTTEGAGVKLNRIFGRADPRLDPFLLLDDFRSDKPDDYIKGFPWHPHRGIETITYMLRGEMEHRDSLGNGGVLRAGDVQWMTAGRGIIHEEMPHQTDGLLWGFQLWANLPASHKMMPPRYQDVPAHSLPVAQVGPGARARVICGEAGGVSGPVQEIVTDPTYLDVTLSSNGYMRHPLPPTHNAMVYVVRGSVRFGPDERGAVTAGNLATLGPGDRIKAFSSGGGARFLLLAGQPINEPVAWHGPIVMNTDQELQRAFQQFRDGTFLKER